MLARVSTQLTTRAQLDALGCNPADCGVTSPPANALAPQFQINCIARGQNKWTASLTILRPAYEGDNHAYHLAPGLYSIGLMQMGEYITTYIPGPGNRQIYVEIDADRSTAARDAEQEHCSDLLYAFDITLGAVQNALQVTRNRGDFAGATSALAVGALVDALCQGLHASLTAIIRRCVTIHPVNVNNALLQQELVALYLATGEKTQDRDGRDWHTLRPDTEESWSAWSWLEYASAKLMPSSVHTALLGDVKDIRRLVQGPSFSVNATPSNQVISL